ncbi:protein N-terminal glutamine amidohydrolase [Dorcoceras hygrometricum]|uniref:Protein N-terminal glutamine amidohydrolase n=1 Tax=Dorcoceras hygrometricum TaxID=472368 RepID=A0A2Z7BPR7_9LAMI|nr:protein N-terminal glutamine amidohydrolase [Dorcoceras hygrometricum]
MATANLDSSPPVSSEISPPGTVSVFPHTPCYCEENVYFLSKKLCEDGIATSDGSDLFVIFISNEQKQIPLWHQKASHRADGVILWDYHVICVQKRKESNLPHLVWDLDSNLPCPSPLDKYVAETIRPSFQLFSQFQRIFRIVHAPLFLRYFASDRRHMKDSAGNWVSPPPSYEAIVAEDGTLHNLNEYMDMSSIDVVKTIGADTVDSVLSKKSGVLISESQLEEFFSMIS